MAYKYFISRPCTEWAIGKEWTFSRYTRRVWEDFAKFARPLLPDPLEVSRQAVKNATIDDADVLRKLMADDAAEMEKAKLENRPPNLLVGMFKGTADAIVEAALQKATSYLQVQSPELSGLLSSHEGGAYLFWLLLKPTNPGITEDGAYDVYMDLYLNDGADGRQKISQILAVCSGTAPEPEKNGSPPAG